MFWLRLAAAICCFTCLYARRFPSYDYFDDRFLLQMKNLLGDREAGKGVIPASRLQEDRSWQPKVNLGQVSGVSFDPEGRPVFFHRSIRIWDSNTFNATNHFQGGGPLQEDVVVVLEPDTGDVIRSWGHGRFLLPHGITVDDKGNTWLTDVGLHQVFKFAPESEEPELTLGEAQVPGSDDRHLCKPTNVAVASSGDFFVGDGYCNARILRFSPDGTLKDQFGHQGSDGSPSSLFVPHGLALDESRDLLCVADRENHRVVCISAGLLNDKNFGEPFMTLQGPNRGRVFDIAIHSGRLVGVSGSDVEGGATGFTADLSNGDLLDIWGPITGFHNPHSIAVSQNGRIIYVGDINPNQVWKFIVDNATGV
ncbi:peptidyl-alpha-hydroxyglycine alpha-amidating lyase 2-like [Homarus americanus]|uniref:Peptidyl-alpha-hydroxyglycine alpha-amidating lyase 2-like n=1 Tax=Homarus americanus TaxID=6706 RepID=A0A8J5K1W0_HOMAM|nr:peptidyl-alpha-hydroxyglycine alpha-amidating lyase 2-like [Homarus americanus]KAG7165205.1 Peptidyl-alpha-hydroxyglycine alpha-amidating lyase 2-like [Homarus americanus]